MKIFYGVDNEKQVFIAPRFLLPYIRIMNKSVDNFYLSPNKQWLLDSSGFTLSVKGETYESQRNYNKYWSPEAYGNFINEWKPNWAFTQDFAFYSKVKKVWTKKEIKHRHFLTNQNTGLIRDYVDKKSILANVVQGIVKEDYLNHIDMMKESGTLTEFLGIGSVFKNPDFIDIITEIKKSVPAYTKLHALGIKKTHLKQHPALTHKLYSIDTAGWISRGLYFAPKNLSDAMLYVFVQDMEKLITETESQNYMDDFEVEE